MTAKRLTVATIGLALLLGAVCGDLSQDKGVVQIPQQTLSPENAALDHSSFSNAVRAGTEDSTTVPTPPPEVERIERAASLPEAVEIAIPAAALVLIYYIILIVIATLLYDDPRTREGPLFDGLGIMLQTPPAWSPDGSLIAFSHEGGVYTIKSDGSGLHLLAGGGARADVDHYDRASSPSISPDGTRIAYAAFKHDGWLPWDWDTDYDWDNVTSAVDGSDRRRLTKGGHMNLSPVWSPDGTRIAFVSNQEEPRSQIGIYTMARTARTCKEWCPPLM